LARFLFNPFLLIFGTFSFSLIMYTLPFSKIYPQIYFSNSAPIIFFMFLNIIAGVIWDKLGLFALKFNEAKQLLSIKIKIIGMFGGGLFLLELLIYGVPLFGQVEYHKFGAPILHVAAISCILVIAIYCSLDTRNNKLTLFLCLLASVIILNRFLFLFIIISITLTALVKVKTKKSFCFIIGMFLMFLILFGELGTLRMSGVLGIPYLDAKNYILDVGYASAYYKATGLSASFYWFWLYVTSPISNLILNIDTPQLVSVDGLFYIFTHEVLPQTISKHLSQSPLRVLHVVPHLNVSTALSSSYVGAGTAGLTLFFIFYSTIYFVIATALKGIYRSIVVILFCTFSCYFIFDNVIKMPIFMWSIIVILFLSVRFKGALCK
jgi:hypothetical protein